MDPGEDKAASATAASSNSGQRGYHHGDLAEALMDAAILQIASEGTENLSLRALARECGVSATAPYRHFPSKRCLFAAIATRGFRELQAHCERARSDAPTPQAQLIAAGGSYIRFAIANPTVYQLMFGSVLEDFSEYDMLTEAAESSYRMVLEILEQLRASRPEMQMGVTELGGVVWSALHGIASLLLFQLVRKDNQGPSSPLASLKALKADPEKAFSLLMQGLIAEAPANP